MSALAFGPFQILLQQRLLLEEGVPVKIGARAFDILALLISQRGRYVTNRELIAHVWSCAVVEDINLRVQVTVLRKALRDGIDGRGYIQNTPGQGYRFVADIQEAENDVPATANRSCLPLLSTTLHGRQNAIEEVKNEIQTHALVTIVGPGGIGKTSVALAVAAANEGAYPDGTYVIDLATIVNPELVASTMSEAIGIPVVSASPMPPLIARLRTRKVLLVIDNCEQVINSVARVADSLLKHCPQVQLLATSREPLLVDGETTYRLGPLEFPLDSALPIGEALDFPAIAMFAERATAADSRFSADDGDVPALVAICRRLDGIPLAIELAASRIELFGLEGLHEQLGDLFTLLSSGRRTALPRHQTLRATVDWSFGLLSQKEQWLLECISVFKSSLSQHAAVAVAAAELSPSEITDTIRNLVSKSLLVGAQEEDEVAYRLLEVTRSYILERVQQRTDREVLLRRYAAFIRDLFVRAEADVANKTSEAWLRYYGRFLDDVRAVLNWALVAAHDLRLAIDLTTSSAPLWIQRSLFSEYQAWVETALKCGSEADILERRDKLRLYMALGHLVLHTKEDPSEMSAAFDRASELSGDGTVAEQCQALGSMWVWAITLANYPSALECARKFKQLAGNSDMATQIVHNRMLALPSHFLGHHDVTREPVAQVLQRLSMDRLAYRTGLQIDVKVSMETILCRTAWLEGRPDEATERSSAMVDWVLTNSNAGTICYFLAITAAPIALWNGDWDLGRGFIQQLEATAEERGLRFWSRWAKCLNYALAHEIGDAVHEPVDPQIWSSKQVDFLATVGVGSVLERGLARVEQGLTGWCAPEILRAWGE